MDAHFTREDEPPVTARVTHRILIVDDEPENVRALQRLLGNRDREIVSVHSGADAIVEAKRAAFVVAIVDIMMPEMDGFETTRVLKRIVPGGIVILATSLHVDRELEERATFAGASSCLPKPLDVVLLHTLVGALLGGA